MTALTLAVLGSLLAIDAGTPLIVRGQFLASPQGYIVLTSGDALRVSDSTVIAPKLRLGEAIRITLDPQTHLARSIDRAGRGTPAPGEVDADHIPPAYIAVDPRSARAIATGDATARAQTTSVTIRVTVPNDTPSSDDIYLSTDRSNFSPAELRMNRVDARHWNVTLPLIVGKEIHYQFTRGNYASIERDSGGGIASPRVLDITQGAQTEDTVARWADRS